MMKESGNKLAEFVFYKTKINKPNLDFGRHCLELENNDRKCIYFSDDNNELILEINYDSPECSDEVFLPEQILLFEKSVLTEEFIYSSIKKCLIIELKVYEIDLYQKEKYNLYRRMFYESACNFAEGLVKVQTFQSAENEKINIDLLFWTDKKSVDKQKLKLTDNKYFRKMKYCVEELLYREKLIRYKK